MVDMGDAEVIDQFQRWLQARLSIAEQIEDPAEKNRTIKRIESAIQLSIQYRQIVSEELEEIPSPFVHRDSPVRLVEDERVTSTETSNTSVCRNCEAEISDDIDFCPSCGEYR